MRQKYKLILLLAAVILLTILLAKVSPVNADIKIYLAVFLIIYLICLLLFWLILDLAYHSYPPRMRLIISVVLAFAPVTVIAISSLSSLSAMDILLAFAIPSIVIWYIYKNSQKKH